MKKKQNGLFGSTLTYVVLFVVLVTVFAWYLRGNSGSTTQELSSSQFLSLIHI